MSKGHQRRLWILSLPGPSQPRVVAKQKTQPAAQGRRLLEFARGALLLGEVLLERLAAEL
jgi:hypothetical protein